MTIPKSEKILDDSLGARRSGIAEVEIVETFTRRCVTCDGRVLYGDGMGFWSNGAASWHGSPPPGWDYSKVAYGHWELRRSVEVDYG